MFTICQNCICCFTGSLTNDIFSGMLSSVCILEMPLLINPSLCNYNMLMTLSSFGNQIVAFFSFRLQFQLIISACNRNSCSHFLIWLVSFVTLALKIISLILWNFCILMILFSLMQCWGLFFVFFFWLKLVKRIFKSGWSKVQAMRLQLSDPLSTSHFSSFHSQFIWKLQDQVFKTKNTFCRALSI